MAAIKFLKASSYYTDYLRQFYEARPELELANHKTQYDALMGDMFASSDSWKRNLESSGLYECMEVITNCEHLQKAWAKENNKTYEEANWKLDILEAEIDEFRPDVFFAHDLLGITPEFRLRVKNKYPKIKILTWDGIAKNDTKLTAGCDMVLSPLEEVAEYYRKNGLASLRMISGFDTKVLEKMEQRKPTVNCSFVGSIFGGENRHNERIRNLSYLSKEAGLEIFIPTLPSYEQLGKEIIKLLLPNKETVFGFGEIMDILNLKSKNKGGYFGLKMYQLLADSKISFNSHIGSAGKQGGNMRMFEATGVGSLLLTDWKENLSDYFDIDKEVIAYKTKHEAEEKIKYYIEHESERQQIAQAGQKRTLNTHNLKQVIEKFSNFLTDNL